MPRKGRIVLPHVSHYICQFGHNNQQVFFCDDDYQFYLDTLWEWKEELDCKVHAYCLLNDQVHLLINPGKQAENLAKLMKRLAGQQTRYINSQYNRSGSLWNGRYKSSPVEIGKYLYDCIRYIESLPQRQQIITLQESYPWASFSKKRCNGRCLGLDLVDDQPSSAGYISYKKDHTKITINISRQQEAYIRLSVQSGHPIGSESFRRAIENTLGVPMKFSGPGRPRKDPEEKPVQYTRSQ